MARAKHLVGIDVGSSTARVVVGSISRDSGQLNILGVGSVPMQGMQKGVITDVEESVKVISRALDKAEQMAGVPVERAYVSINGAHIVSQNSRGVIAVSRADGEISSDDVSRVINAAQAISLPNNREILHVLPQNFIVDGQEHIQDPVGMTGVRLEVEAHIISGSVPAVKNLTKVINRSGIHIEDFVFAPLAASLSVLEKRQRELGCVLVDLGAGTTSLAVYEENTLLHTAVLSLGSSHITNDIAIGLRTSLDVAEAIKLQHGTAFPEEVKANETIVVEGEDGSEQQSVPRQEVANIIGARLGEIFSFVDRELKLISRSGLLPAGVILTGGGAHLSGVIEMAKQRLRLPARIGKPRQLQGVAIEQINDPAAAVLTGLLLWSIDQQQKSSPKTSLALPDVGQTVHRIKDWLRSFLP